MMNELLVKGREALANGEWEKAKDFLDDALKIEKSPEVYEALSWACWWLNDAAGIFENRPSLIICIWKKTTGSVHHELQTG